MFQSQETQNSNTRRIFETLKHVIFVIEPSVAANHVFKYKIAGGFATFKSFLVILFLLLHFAVLMSSSLGDIYST